MKRKQKSECDVNKIEYYFENNSFLELLIATEKYKEIFCSLEAKFSALITSATVILFYYIFNSVEIEVFNDVIRNLLINFVVGFIGMLGFIVGGMAIISGTISNKVVDEVISEGEIKALVGILYSFYFIGAIIGITLVLYVFMYIFTYTNMCVTKFSLITTTSILGYFGWFVILYSVALLGTCLKIFLVNYKFSKGVSFMPNYDCVNKTCPKCNGKMMEGYTNGKFSGVREDGACGGTDTKRYMCKKCGYIEEYAIKPKFYTDKN